MFPMSHGVVNQILGATGGGGGSGPVIESTSTGSENSNTATHTITLPGGVTTGDLVLVLFRTGGTSVTHTLPSGWDEIATLNSNGRTTIFARACDGSEGASVAVSTGASTRLSAFVAYRIAGAAVAESAYVEATLTTANTFSKDSNSLTPTWGAAENLWLWHASTRRTDNTFTKPSDHGDQTDSLTGAAGSTSNLDVRLATAHLLLNASTHQPQDWDFTGTLNAPHTGTVAVRPA